LLLVSLAVLGAIAALLLVTPRLLDQERYRSLLADRVSRQLDRQVAAEGLRIRFLPSPGASILGVTIADRAPWSGTFIEAERLDVNLKLLPLLRGDFQVTRIRIDRPRIRVVQGPAGWNIDDLVGPAARPPSTEQRRGQGTKPAKGQPMLPILLAGAMSVRGGTLVVDRHSRGTGPTVLEIRDLNVDAGAPSPSTPIRIDVSGRLPGEASGSFELSCRARPEDADRLPLEAHLRIRDAAVPHLVSSLGLDAPSAGALSGTVDLEVRAAGDWPRLDVEADADLTRLAVALGDTGGKAPGEKMRLHAKGQWDGEALDLRETSLRWKEQAINGRLRVATLTTPRIRFDLDTPRLEIDPLLAIATDLNTDGSSTHAAWRGGDRRARSSDTRERTSRADGVELEGRVRSGAVHWRGVLLTAVETDLRYARGLLAIRRLRGGLYGGVLSGDAALALHGREPRTSIKAHLEGVQVEPLLKALHGERWRLSGIMALDSSLELVGRPGPGALANAVGQSDLVVTGGRVTGYPPLDKVTQTFDLILKEVGVSARLNEFDRLTAHWTLNNGVLTTRDLLLQRAGGTLSAAGSMNLVDRTLDFDVKAKVAKATLEARVSGTPADPVVTVDVGRIERRIKTEVGKALKDERGKAWGKMLRELLAR
jgi:AsmA protein